MAKSESKSKPKFALIGAVLLASFLVYAWFNLELYTWVKALHVIAVISWMAGMLYLPRLFVYHSAEPVGSEISEKFKVMEQKLLKVIINPAMMVAWICGLWMIFSGIVPFEGWLIVKLIAVFVLSGFHGFLSKSVKLFAADQNQRSERSWRLLNEVPTVLMIIVVIMVIVRPF